MIIVIIEGREVLLMWMEIERGNMCIENVMKENLIKWPDNDH